MVKNIVICADGTGNSAITGRGTNVFKLYEAIDEHSHRLNPALGPQVALYHDGVGTESFKWLRFATGATGWGLSRNVKQLYGELARVYDPGDRIFLFGFSRGAFTVRTLAGLIATCGVLDLAEYDTNEGFKRAQNAAYRAYRRKYQTRLSKMFFGKRVVDVDALRKQFSVKHPELAPGGRIPIHFLGVWDTVDAVGAPFHIADLINSTVYQFKFPDTELNGQVRHAYHALALDEERESFKPVLWSEREAADRERIEQVWFAGVHSNVGGGYPRHGMSLAALDWLMAKAEGEGLRFNAADRELFRGHVAVHDKLYDSRAGMGMFYRWAPRDVRRLSDEGGVQPKIHRSVFDRIARNTEGYAPGSIPAGFTLVSSTLPSKDARAIEGLVQAAHKGAPSLMGSDPYSQKLGQVSYWLLVAAVICLVGAGLAMYVGEAMVKADGWYQKAVSIATGFITGRWISIVVKALWERPEILAGTVSLLVLAYGLQLLVDARLDRRYSQFWHGLRRPLRKTLGF